MLVALVYWAIISSLAISFSIYVLYQEVYNGNESHIYRKSEHLIYGISSTWLTMIQNWKCSEKRDSNIPFPFFSVYFSSLFDRFGELQKNEKIQPNKIDELLDNHLAIAQEREREYTLNQKIYYAPCQKL